MAFHGYLVGFWREKKMIYIVLFIEEKKSLKLNNRGENGHIL
jgi:hypothetical protein